MARIKADFGQTSNAVATTGGATPAANASSMSFRDRLTMKPAARSGVEYLQVLLDVSGSMDNQMKDGTQKMESAKKAVRHFLTNSSPHRCGIGLIGFGFSHRKVQIVQTITHTFGLIDTALDPMQPESSTPMDEALEMAIQTHFISRAIVVSDGLPDNPQACFTIARDIYKERGYPIDTIYIGEQDDRGFHFMKELAAITGGIFAFASNLDAFKTAFAQLETSARLQIADHRR